jgi:hypothetical protein
MKYFACSSLVPTEKASGPYESVKVGLLNRVGRILTKIWIYQGEFIFLESTLKSESLDTHSHKHHIMKKKKFVLDPEKNGLSSKGYRTWIFFCCLRYFYIKMNTFQGYSCATGSSNIDPPIYRIHDWARASSNRISLLLRLYRFIGFKKHGYVFLPNLWEELYDGLLRLLQSSSCIPSYSYLIQIQKAILRISICFRRHGSETESNYVPYPKKDARNNWN